KVTEADWFYQMWDKITPQLRGATASAKHLWHHNFNEMVLALTSTDLENRRNLERNPYPAYKKNTPSGGSKPGASGSGATTKSAPKSSRPFSSSGTAPTPRPTAALPK